MKKPMEPRIEWVPLGSLKPAKRNPKKHDIEGIAGSISTVGFAEVLIENAATGRLVAGHGRDEALRLLHSRDPKKLPKFLRHGPAGSWLIPVLRGVAFKSEAEAEAYLLADNFLVERGGWTAELPSVLARLQEQGGAAALAVAGWSQPDYEKLLASVAARSDGDTAAPGAAGEGAIRQIVFPFESKAMPRVLARLARVMERTKTENHSEVLLRLLEAHEAG